MSPFRSLAPVGEIQFSVSANRRDCNTIALEVGASHPVGRVRSLLYTAAMVFGWLLAVGVAVAPPCISASPNCTEWVKPSGQTSQVLAHRNYPLETKNENITRAFVFVHGINRDADNHFRTALPTAFLADTLNDTAIVVPRFASNSSAPGNQAGNCRDTIAPNEANWVCDSATARHMALRRR